MMGEFEWTFANFKGSMFIIVFGFVFLVLYLQLRSVNKTIADRKAKESLDESDQAEP